MSVAYAHEPLATKTAYLKINSAYGIVFPYVFIGVPLLKHTQKHEQKYQDEKIHTELMNRIKQERSEESFKELFQFFYPKLLVYFRKGGVLEQKASDLTQEALLIVWNKASFFDSSKGSCAAWIYTIARNLKYDHFRAHNRDILTFAAEDIYSFAEDPALQLDVKNIDEDVRERIHALPQEQKEVVQAMYFDGYSHGEYAELKKIPLGTVKSRIRLAIAQIKKGLEDL